MAARSPRQFSPVWIGGPSVGARVLMVAGEQKGSVRRHSVLWHQGHGQRRP